MVTLLLLYSVGLAPMSALGTGALAVSANAFVNLAGHPQGGHRRWAVVVALSNARGAWGGSTVGKATRQQQFWYRRPPS